MAEISEYRRNAEFGYRIGRDLLARAEAETDPQHQRRLLRRAAENLGWAEINDQLEHTRELVDALDLDDAADDPFRYCVEPREDGDRPSISDVCEPGAEGGEPTTAELVDRAHDAVTALDDLGTGAAEGDVDQDGQVLDRPSDTGDDRALDAADDAAAGWE